MAAARSPATVALFHGASGPSVAPFGQRSSAPGPVEGEEERTPSEPPVVAPLRPSPPAPRRTAPGETRPLTSGETGAARTVFGDAVDYRRVKVHRDEYLPFGLQPDDTAMTPNGEMYFNTAYFQEDFAATFEGCQWFMHEMVHVWQYQLGYPVKLRGAIRIGLDYRYTLESGKRLGDYNMEAQGNLLADYWSLINYASPPQLFEEKHRHDLVLYRQVLAGFIADPSDKASLP